MSLDADDVGFKIQKLIIEEKEKEIVELSNIIKKYIKDITLFLSNQNLEIVISAGDNILCKGAFIDIQKITSYLFKKNSIIKCSVGIGNSLKNCYLALNYAKSIGKNTIVRYENKDQIEVFSLSLELE
ncbi:MAG: mCpol domain-containing protein [Promethearchaeota archaeon]